MHLCNYWVNILAHRIPSHLDGVPILSLESNPEFEADSKRAGEMMEQVCIV